MDSMRSDIQAVHRLSAWLRFAPALALAGALAGCSSFDISDLNPFTGEKYKMEVEPIVPASRVYDQGLAKLANGDPNEAAKKFTDLGKKYPGSDWARKGLLMTTYAQYTDGQFDDAAGSASRYIKEYPQSPEAPYALYLQAQSHYAQIMDIARDQDHAEKALQLYKQLVQTYPKSEYVDDSKAKMQVAFDQLGGKEMSIGRFYENRRNYAAAINRFRNVLTAYQTTRHAEEALYRLTECYMALGVTDEAETAAAILGHNFPDSEWYKNAYTLLKTGGLSPQDHPDSWISKLYKTIVPT
jgi:outer membrane protein assembly factor BamD